MKISKRCPINLLIIMSFVVVQAMPALAQTLPNEPQIFPRGQRPKIGLVLGGGGARGAAHIGVIRRLEELHIPIDCVAGTSMGGLVAGAYATGLTAPEMQQALQQANWRDIFNDAPSYEEFDFRNKNLAQTYIPGTEGGVKNGGVQFPTAVLSGQKIKFFINRLIGADTQTQLIEKQKLPLALIATDIVTGQRQVFREGNLATVMRATMSVPGLVAPVKYVNRLLVDGGLVDNVPIQEAHLLCQPDVIIAVNVGSPLLNQVEIESSPLGVASQMVNILTEQNVTQSLKLLKPNIDIYLQPDLEGITASDFEKNALTIERGYQAASKVDQRLSQLSVSQEDYVIWQQNHQRDVLPHPRIDAIEVADQGQEAMAIQDKIANEVGKVMDTDRLEQNLLQIYGEGNHESLDYEVLSIHDRHVLKILPAAKSWGPNFLRAGVNLGWGSSGDADYNLRLAYQMTQLNRRNGQVLVAGQLGSVNRFGLSYYQPIDQRQRTFLELSGNFTSKDLLFYENNQSIAKYRNRATEIKAALGYNLQRYGVIQLGTFKRWQSANLKIGLETNFPQHLSTRVSGWYVGADFDRMNRLYFPTEGWALRSVFTHTHDYGKFSVDGQSAYRLGNYVINGRASYITATRGELPLYDAAALGGLNFISGLAHQQVIGNKVWYLGLRTEKIVSKMPLGIRGDLRLGLGLEAGQAFDRYSEKQSSGLLNSVSLYLGGETPIGPFYFGVSKANNNVPRVYLFLGTP